MEDALSVDPTGAIGNPAALRSGYADHTDRRVESRPLPGIYMQPLTMERARGIIGPVGGIHPKRSWAAHPLVEPLCLRVCCAERRWIAERPRAPRRMRDRPVCEWLDWVV
jgi:hypothetical protein